MKLTKLMELRHHCLVVHCLLLLHLICRSVIGGKSVLVAKCGKTYPLDKFERIIMVASGNKCDLDIMGSENCVAEIKCPELNLSKDCKQSFLRIDDGVSGEATLCEGDKLDTYLRSRIGNDLFITYRGRSLYDNLGCQIRCGLKHQTNCPTRASSKCEPEKHLNKRRVNENCVCGKTMSGRIVNGEGALPFEFPWMAAIVYSGTRKPVCGGTLINDRMILTATHCFHFSGLKESDVEILLHAHILNMQQLPFAKDIPSGLNGSIRGPGYNLPLTSDYEEDTMRIKVKQIVVHPLFTEKYDFDAAVLEIEPIDFRKNPAVSTVCLPSSGRFNGYSNYEPVVAGWGLPHENAGANSRILQKLRLPIIENNHCEEVMNYSLSSRMMCAGFLEGIRDACLGDSGGPLMHEQLSGQVEQIGIVSWGEGCARKDRPGVYSRVTEFLQWIERISRDINAVWCSRNQQ